jgi:hypothetical protein
MSALAEPSSRQDQLLKRVVVTSTLVLLLVLAIPSVPAAAAGASGTIKDTNNQGVPGAFVMLFDNDATVIGAVYPTLADGSFTLKAPPGFTTPISDATVDNLDGFIIEQPGVNIGALPGQLGIYQYQPRAYLKPPNTPLNVVLPAASSFVLKGNKQDGSVMRWGDFVSTGPGTEGAQFMYLTNMDEEQQPAVNWPTYDQWARNQGGNRNDGFPSLVVDSRKTGKYSISAMYWNVKNYGKLCLRADNAGAGFDLPATGTALVIDLNLELARTAIHDLQRRQDFYETYITDENITALISALNSVGNVDDRLHDALQLRDRLELKAAQNSIAAVRKGTLRVTAHDTNGRAVPGCAVTINQTAHDFLFGANGGTMPDPADPPAPLWQKIRDAGFELAPVLPAWGFTENPATEDYWGKDAIETTFGISNIMDYGLKVKFTGSVWMQGAPSLGILPPRAATMTWEQIQAANIANQDRLLDDFKNDPVIWEVMNEPATTNTVGMPRDEMAEMMNTSALHIKAANPNMETLVNSPSEFDFGFRYQSYKLDGATPPNDNVDLNGYNTTYSDFLKQARTMLGSLDSIDIIGLQFYPGAHVSSTYGEGEAPAFTPSWLVDAANRYNSLFGKPVHITELSFPTSYDLGTWHSGYWREPWTETTQADYAESIYTMMFANPEVHSVLYWDTPDDGAFVVSGGLVRSDLSEKPSYQRIKALIASWTTVNEQGTTNALGQSVLPGFGGDYSVTVTGPDGHVENRTAHMDERQQNTLVVDGFSALPETTSISPDHKTAGDSGFTLTVNGTDFVAGSKVHWNGAERVTTYVSPTRVTATILASDIASIGTASVTVVNDSGESDAQTFTVDPVPVPTTTGLNPSSKTAGDAGFPLTVNGTNFVSGSVVKWNGANRTTTYVSPTELTATILASDIASTGTASITVYNPAPGGGTSKARKFAITKVLSTPKWYLAEGTSDYGFDTYVTMENPNPSAVTAQVTYMTKTGAKTRPALTLPPMSQTTINPRNDIGAADFSTKVVCKEGKTIVVDRRMTWTGPGAASQEGTSSVGITAPAKTWYLAEGSSKWGFETWLLIQNPNSKPARCTVTYMTAEQGAKTFAKTVAANSRASFNMADDIGAADASVKVVADQLVIPERAMYRNSRREGHDSIGTTTPAKDYYLAEGTTGYGFTTYVLVQNPNAAANSVTITCMTPGGPVNLPAITVPGNSRRTVRLNDPLPGKDLSTHVHGTLPLIAERAMYWGAGGPLGEACHDSIGMSEPHATFFLPDGETQNGYETWTLVQNPNSVDVKVEVRYLRPGGTGNVVFTDTVKAQSRKSYNMADKLGAGKASVVVTSKTTGKKIMCERAMYWNSRGAGTDTIGGYSD